MRALACVLLLIAAPAAADPRGVTLDDARAAAAKAPETAAAHQRTVAASADADAAGPWPETTLEVQTARVSPRLVTIASVPLPVFGVERAARRTLTAEAEAIRAEEATTAADLRQRATEAWLALYRAQARAQIASQTADRLASLEDVTRKRQDAHDASQAEVVSASTQASRAKIDADAAASEVSAASADLAVALGWDPAQDLSATGDLPKNQPPALDAIADKITTHPELRAQERRVDAAGAAFDEARLGGRPQLSFDIEVDTLDPSDGPTDVLIGLAVALPIGGRTGKRVDAARAHVAAEQAEAGAIESRLRGELVAAHRRWLAASKRAASLRDTLVPQQETSTDLVRKSYQAGEVDLASVIQSERDLLDVRGEAVDADVAAAEAWAELEHAAGGPL